MRDRDVVHTGEGEDIPPSCWPTRVTLDVWLIRTLADLVSRSCVRGNARAAVLLVAMPAMYETRNVMNSLSSGTRRTRVVLTSAAGASVLLFSLAIPATAAVVAKVPLATSAQYSVLGGSTVTNTGPSILGQSLGVSPGTSITGFPPGTVLGTTNATNAAAAQAESDLTAAYLNAEGRPIDGTTTADLANLTLQGGVDFPVAPNFKLAPFINLAIGSYTNASASGNSSSSFNSAVHELLTVGLRGSFNL